MEPLDTTPANSSHTHTIAAGNGLTSSPASAVAVGSIAIGQGSSANGPNSVAIGTGVVVNDPNTIGLGATGTVVQVDTLHANTIRYDKIEPLATQKFPHPMVLKSGDTVKCSFTLNTGEGQTFFVKEAILHGVPETEGSHAIHLAHLIDSLAHFAEGLPKTEDDCSPSLHLRRAIKELTHAMLALDATED